MDVVEVLSELGGFATRRELLQHVAEWQVRKAVDAGRLVRIARGRYALPTTSVAATGWDEAARRTALAARRAAHETSGTAVLLSAAARWGWATKWSPKRPQVAVPRGRKVTSRVQASIDVQWRALAPGEVDSEWVTDRVRTVLDCSSFLAGDEALCVVDSALREGAVTRDELLLAAARLAPRFRGRAEPVIRMGDAQAANPFESVLRWIAADVPGLTVQPQHRIDDAAGFVGRVDLADDDLRIVLEADSVEFHSTPEQLEKDCTRYTRLTADDWLVLRFTWKQVMNRPEWVRDAIVRTVALRQAQRALQAA